MGRYSLIGQVHCRCASLKRRTEATQGHCISLYFYFASSSIIMETLMNLLILFTFYSLLQDINREETSSRPGRMRWRWRQRKWVPARGGDGSIAKKVMMRGEGAVEDK